MTSMARRWIAFMATALVVSTSQAGTLEDAREKASSLEAESDWSGVLDVLARFADAHDDEVDGMIANALLMRAVDGKQAKSVTAADVQPAIDSASACAARGNGQCMNLLYSIYWFGMGVPEDESKAIGYLKRAVEAGDLGARVTYASLLYRGAPEVEKNVDLACGYFREAVDTPAAPVASYYLGLVKFRGQCGEKADRQEGMALVQIAADHGIREAERDIAKNYQFGWTTTPDVTRAAEWYERAALHGDPESAWRLGMAYVEGAGRKPDATQAVRWFEESANSGYGAGKVSLAVMYATGDGVERDYAKARSLYESAAEQGEAHAYRGLAVMHARGEGMPVDFVTARVLYAQAIELGDEPDEAFRRQLDSRLSSEQIEEVNRRVEAWKRDSRR